MKKLKITKNEVDSKSIHFHFPSDNRHVDFGQLLKQHFTTPPASPTEINQITHTKTNQHGSQR